MYVCLLFLQNTATIIATTKKRGITPNNNENLQGECRLEWFTQFVKGGLQGEGRRELSVPDKSQKGAQRPWARGRLGARGLQSRGDRGLHTGDRILLWVLHIPAPPAASPQYWGFISWKTRPRGTGIRESRYSRGLGEGERLNTGD